MWCQKTLPVRGTWQTDGPPLPLEFARKSKDGRITLVIREEGTPCDTLWAELAVDNLENAREALRSREDVPKKNFSRDIGHWTPEESTYAHGQAIGDWAAGKGFKAVVWTALPPKSPVTDNNGDFPSENEVCRYLQELNDDKLERAKEYVQRAPRQIKTAYRPKIEALMGWTHTGVV